jgi:hypothetical protein
MNLIPLSPGPSPHHWCTWQRQNAAAIFRAGPGGLLDAAGAQAARDALVQEHLAEWMAEQHPRARQDLLVVLDDGWDLPLAPAEVQKPWFGMHQPHPDRFPGPADPAARLAALVDLARGAGWKGLGGWICVQEPPHLFAGQTVLPAERESHWRGLARLFREAGARYWKCDWGAACRDEEVRRLLSRVAREEAPGLWVEHTVCRWPLNDWQKSLRMSSELAGAGASTLAYSDVFRTYDVLTPLSVPTTLERVARHLADARMEPQAKGLVHCEDEATLGAVLGCVIGVMRYAAIPGLAGLPNPVFPPRFESQRPILAAQDEVARALRWSRIAPAWRAGDAVRVDAETLEDSWCFGPDETTFSEVIGQVIHQRAPARVARGGPVPRVQSEGDAPYVISSRHANGACAIATLGRVDARRGWRVPRADIELDLGDVPVPCGIFGHYHSLTLRSASLHPRSQVLVQDLLADEAVPLTQGLRLGEGWLTLDGEAIDRIGTAAATPGDRSEPGLVLSWR